MNTDEENNVLKPETVKVQKKKNFRSKLAKHWQIGIKIIELMICALCMGLMYEPASNINLRKEALHHIGIMYTAYTGYILINVILLTSKLVKDSIPYKTVTIFALNGAALFLITSILLMVDRTNYFRSISYHPHSHRRSLVMLAVIFGFINVIVFSADALFTFRLQQDF